jgi:hypothetical protein
MGGLVAGGQLRRVFDAEVVVECERLEAAILRMGSNVAYLRTLHAERRSMLEHIQRELESIKQYIDRLSGLT